VEKGARARQKTKTCSAVKHCRREDVSLVSGRAHQSAPERRTVPPTDEGDTTFERDDLADERAAFLGGEEHRIRAAICVALADDRGSGLERRLRRLGRRRTDRELLGRGLGALVGRRVGDGGGDLSGGCFRPEEPEEQGPHPDDGLEGAGHAGHVCLSAPSAVADGTVLMVFGGYLTFATTA